MISGLEQPCFQDYLASAEMSVAFPLLIQNLVSYFLSQFPH
jgi:hypothetical protein